MTNLSKRQSLKILSENVVRARMHYDIWWFLEGAASRPSILETIDDFPEYFLISSDAHFASMIVRSRLLWDNRNDVISVKNVANRLLDRKRFTEHEQLFCRIENAQEQAKGIEILRNSVVAHVSVSKNRSELFREAGIKPNDILRMMSLWLELINKLREIYDYRPCNKDARLGSIEFRELALRDLQNMIVRLGGPDLRSEDSLGKFLG